MGHGHGALLQTLEGHSVCVLAVAFSTDSRQLASVSDANKVTSYNGTTGEPDEKAAVAFSPDGRQPASTSDNSTVRLWDVATGVQVRRCKSSIYVSRLTAYLKKVIRQKTAVDLSSDFLLHAYYFINITSHAHCYARC